jgi:DNA-binding XRE family transcriptional regulator
LIRRQREKKGFTQEALAEALEISIETMKAIEGGRRHPSLPLLFHTCLFLGIEVAFKA